MMNLKTFAGRTQFGLVILMLLAFILLGQRVSLTYYKVGFVLMVVSSLTQIAFGIISPDEEFGRTIKLYLIFTAITAAVFIISILIAPILVGLGR